MYEPRIGRRFGRLTVTEKVERAGRDSNHVYLCHCDCGGTKLAKWKNLTSGGTKSCGCLANERVDKARTGNDIGHNHPLYDTWHMMVRRCYDQKCAGFKKYGAKGVAVCDAWRQSAKAFVDHMGPKPSPHHTLDRNEPFGNYEPGNCRWADKFTQATNKRNGSNVYVIEIRGKKAFASEWAKALGVNLEKVTRDIRRGIDPAVAVIAAKLRKQVWEQRQPGEDPNPKYAACYEKAEKLLAINPTLC